MRETGIAAYVTRSWSSAVERGLHDGLNDGVAAFLRHVVTHGWCPFSSAVCACRPSRKCVPSARPRPCQGRQPRRGWSEAESLYRVAASRRLAVVMAGFVPFVRSCRSVCVPVVSFRSGDPWPATRAGARDLRETVSQPRLHVRKRPAEEWSRFSSERQSGSCLAGVAPAFDSWGRVGRLKTSLRCAPALRGLDPPNASLDLAITGASPL